MSNEKPILFTSAMVNAILSGRKNQTRRIIKPQPDLVYYAETEPNVQRMKWKGCMYRPAECGSPFNIGMNLWVKEAAWMFCEKKPNGLTETGRKKFHYTPLRAAPVYYISDDREKPDVSKTHPDTGNEWVWKYKNARYVPRWASRITLEITGVRVERLWDISEEDALAEGVERHNQYFKAYNCKEGVAFTAKKSFETLWHEINGPESLDSNPWLWVISFSVTKHKGAK